MVVLFFSLVASSFPDTIIPMQTVVGCSPKKPGRGGGMSGDIELHLGDKTSDYYRPLRHLRIPLYRMCKLTSLSLLLVLDLLFGHLIRKAMQEACHRRGGREGSGGERQPMGGYKKRGVRMRAFFGGDYVTKGPTGGGKQRGLC